jgi:hypothetical protein
MAVRTAPLVDKALGGRGALKRRLRTGRRAGHSNQQIADAIGAELGIDLSRETVRKWCRDLGIDQEQTR